MFAFEAERGCKVQKAYLKRVSYLKKKSIRYQWAKNEKELHREGQESSEY